MRGLAFLVISVCLLASCVGVADAPTSSDLPKVDGAPAPTAVATTAASPAARPTPAPRQYAKLRVFVASESTDQVWVFDGAPDAQFALTAKIPVGRMPHQLSVSPDGRFVAVNNRMAGTTSVIDPTTMKEIARLPVGKQPHGILWSPDAKTLFVASERDGYIARYDSTSWKSLPPLMVGVPQHVLAMSAARPNELWFTVTNSSENDHLRAYDLTTKQITRVKVNDVHDAYFTPDGSEIWSSSSGFLDKMSDRMVISDPVTKAVKQEIHLAGHYPFHTLKVFQDGVYYPSNTNVMILSDHASPSLLWLDWRERSIVGETKLGQQPFHSTYDPEGDRMLVTTNVDGMVNVIDMKTRQVVQKLPVAKAHGIASVGMAAP